MIPVSMPSRTGHAVVGSSPRPSRERGLKPAATYLLSVLSGALLVLSLPKPDLYPLAWIALVPLFFVVATARSVTQTVLGSYLAGVVFFCGTFYWITETMSIYGGLSLPLAIGVGALFALLFAFYFVLFALGL